MFSYFDLVTLVITGAVALASQSRGGYLYLRQRLKLISVSVVVAILGTAFYLTLTGYKLWLDDPLAKFLLPPYQDLNYFIFYSFTHFFAPYLTSLAGGLLLFLGMRALNKKFGERFFEEEEPYLAALSIFLTGHPGWLVYLVVLITMYFLLHTTYYLLQRKTARLPLYRLWAPIAFFVILLNEFWLGETSFWQLLSF